MPQYFALTIVLKDIKEEDKPKGVNVYLTSNKTWPNIARERWPQTNPNNFFIEFTATILYISKLISAMSTTR